MHAFNKILPTGLIATVEFLNRRVFFIFSSVSTIKVIFRHLGLLHKKYERNGLPLPCQY